MFRRQLQANVVLVKRISVVGELLEEESKLTSGHRHSLAPQTKAVSPIPQASQRKPEAKQARHPHPVHKLATRNLKVHVA